MGLPDWAKDAALFAVNPLAGQALAAGKALGGMLSGPDIPNEKIPTPPPAPDLTDQAVKQARLAARRRVLIGQGMGGTFLSGPLGDPSAPPTRAATLSGY